MGLKAMGSMGSPGRGERPGNEKGVHDTFQSTTTFQDQEEAEGVGKGKE